MRIRSIKAEDYEALGKVHLDFDAMPPVTMIAGKVTGGGASSNGAGKSSVLSSILWCLYGRSVKERAKDRVVRDGAKSCSVTVVVKLDSGDDLTVVRKRSKAGGETITVNGQTAATASGGQEMIDAALRVPYDVFTTTILFTGDASAFCRLQPAQRTRLLQAMLGVGKYEAAEGSAKRAAADAKNAYESKAAIRRVLEDDVERASRALRAQIADNAESEALAEATYRDLLAEINEAMIAYDARVKDLEAARGRTVQQDTTYDAKFAEWKRKMADAKAAVTACAEKASTALRAYEAANAALRECQHQIAAATKKDHPDVCPTCRRSWPSDKRPIDVTPMLTQQKLLEAKRAACKDAMTAAEREQAKADSLYHSLENERPERPKPDTTLTNAEVAASQANYRIKVTTDRADEARAAWKAAESTGARRRAECEKDLARAKAKIDGFAADLEALERRARITAYWAEAFGRNGIPAYLLAESAPALTESARKYATMLTEGAYDVSFAFSESGRGTDFNVAASNPEGGSEYGDLSKGELARVDLCALLAVREFVAARAGITPEQCFIDELFDGVDTRGMEIIGRLMRKQRIAKQWVYVSHDDTLQESAQAVVTIEKRGGVASVAGQAKPRA